jgi:hypothetical protein
MSYIRRLNARIEIRHIIPESFEVPYCIVHVVAATHFSNAVHAPLRDTHVHCSHTRSGGYNGADGTSTAHVTSHHKFLFYKDEGG